MIFTFVIIDSSMMPHHETNHRIVWCIRMLSFWGCAKGSWWQARCQSSAVSTKILRCQVRCMAWTLHLCLWKQTTKKQIWYGCFPSSSAIYYLFLPDKNMQQSGEHRNVHGTKHYWHWVNMSPFSAYSSKKDSADLMRSYLGSLGCMSSG